MVVQTPRQGMDDQMTSLQIWDFSNFVGMLIPGSFLSMARHEYFNDLNLIGGMGRKRRVSGR